MIDVLTKHLSVTVAEEVRDDYAAITRLLIRGIITVDEAAVDRERLTNNVLTLLQKPDKQEAA